MNTIYQFAAADYYVMFAYLLMFPIVGLVMKRFCGSSRDYLICGNRIPWWLAGGSIFMMSFSAWTFTGAAGFAYRYGVLIILIFYFNVIGYLIAGRFTAARLRQTRLVTYGQIIYERFGRFGEQFFIWLQFPKMLLGGAIWLLGLSIFISVAFGIPTAPTILLAGTIILIYTTISGSWAVMTTDFLQSVVLMILTIIIAILTLMKTGGIGGLVAQMEPSHLQIFSKEHSPFWALVYCIQMCMLFNSVIGANKFLAVRDGKAARKAAYFAAALFFIGPLVWFIPPLAASFLFPHIEQQLSGLSAPSDGAYVLMGLQVLPPGLVGLMVMVIFGATLSSMDTAINVNAGIISMNIYKPFFRPSAGEREMLLVSRISNLFCGTLVMMTAYLLSQRQDLNLFDLSLLMLSVLGLPMAVPCVLVYFFRKTPRWAAAWSVMLSCSYSLYTAIHKWDLVSRNTGVVLICIAVFVVARLFWSRTAESTKDAVNRFYEKMDRPVDADREIEGCENVGILSLVGLLAILLGGVVSGLLLFPGSAGTRAVIAVTAVCILIVGVGLRYLGQRFISRQVILQK